MADKPHPKSQNVSEFLVDPRYQQCMHAVFCTEFAISMSLSRLILHESHKDPRSIISLEQLKHITSLDEGHELRAPRIVNCSG